MSDPAARALRDTLARRLRGAANVHGVGLGGRWRADEPTGEGCLTVFVERKVHRHALSRADLVPTGLGDLRIDVVAVPRPRRLSTVPYEVPGAQHVPSKLTWRLVADNRTYPVLCGGIQIMSNVRQPGQAAHRLR
ncbi:hypothetical protein ACQEVZ_55880 [Dactylosporangium sp. CA-152071]|uniref:hypothetical protein n=1 Tax=Dactylosporangium sp. CA-152071 TaxID=3239933 RepID=UPI003D8B2C6E